MRSVPIEPREPNAEVVRGLHALIQELKELKYAFDGLTDGNGTRVEAAAMVKPRVWAELMRELTLTTELVGEAAKSRTKIPQRCHHLIKGILVTESSMLQASASLLEVRKKLLVKYGSYIGKKQAHKHIRGKEPNQLEIFKPRNRDVAIFMGWYGTQCDSCSGWRMELSPESGAPVGLIRCVDCSHFATLAKAGAGAPQCRRCGTILWTDIIQKHARRYRDCPTLAHMDCPGCGFDLEFPVSWRL